MYPRCCILGIFMILCWLTQICAEINFVQFSAAGCVNLFRTQVLTKLCKLCKVERRDIWSTDQSSEKEPQATVVVQLCLQLHIGIRQRRRQETHFTCAFLPRLNPFRRSQSSLTFDFCRATIISFPYTHTNTHKHYQCWFS